MTNGGTEVEGEKNFIDFILDAQNDNMLVSQFLLYTDPNDLNPTSCLFLLLSRKLPYFL